MGSGRWRWSTGGTGGVSSVHILMKTNAALQFSSVARRLLSLWVVVAALLPAACRLATATGPAAADPRPLHRHIGDDFLGETFVPIDPATLAARPDLPSIGRAAGRPTARPGWTREMTAGWGSADPATIWIVVVYDVATGSERARFHPPAAGMAVGLSADGRAAVAAAPSRRCWPIRRRWITYARRGRRGGGRPRSGRKARATARPRWSRRTVRSSIVWSIRRWRAGRMRERGWSHRRFV